MRNSATYAVRTYERLAGNKSIHFPRNCTLSAKTKFVSFIHLPHNFSKYVCMVGERDRLVYKSFWPTSMNTLTIT
jgi:hypothetical protein